MAGPGRRLAAPAAGGDQPLRAAAARARHKLNIGALGNVVRQLHVHVLARSEGDAAWPAPAWGSGPAQRYPAAQREALLETLRRHMESAGKT
jgi:diadenosine tetraphosphate (Ap4A) HIT family hydrolase